MAAPFTLKILTPRGMDFFGEVTKLIVRTTEGDVGILKGHTNYLAAISIGRLTIVSEDGTRRQGAVNGGFLSMIDGEANVSAVSFEWADEIDVTRANRSKELAERVLSTKSHDTEHALAKLRLSRALNRIDVHSDKKF